jgi:FkbM family methyltransferase
MYPEGSIAEIKSGYLAGYKWKRSHRYVNGYWVGIYELSVQKCLVRELRAGDVFYDVGANAGFFSLLAAKCVGDKGHVFAFEPLQQNIEAAKSEFELNKVVNCDLVAMAVSDRNGEVEFCEGKDASTAHIRGLRPASEASTIVHSITLDEFAKSKPWPSFIKIDVEGAEIMVLEGAREILESSYPPKLLIEFHGEDFAEKARCLLERSRYRFFTLDRVSVDPNALPHHMLALPIGSSE